MCSVRRRSSVRVQHKTVPSTAVAYMNRLYSQQPHNVHRAFFILPQSRSLTAVCLQSLVQMTSRSVYIGHVMRMRSRNGELAY